jgi:hypothetical protein
MKQLSTSLTLGKASNPHGANPEHNHREFVSDNVDVNRIRDNVTYVRQHVRDAYKELFGEALEAYNAKQKRADRKIHDYFDHVDGGGREESYYEIIVQFGSVKTAPVESPTGELAKAMLDEYMHGFKQRNPNLHVFSATLHMDEASPHIHIDFIPFYTEPRKNGLSKGVSMKAALIEQGFNPKSMMQNQLVAWEENELKVMEQILNRHGLERDVKNTTHEHMTLPEYKKSQDGKKLTATKWTRELPEKLQLENSLLRVERDKLLAEKNAEWRSFYYSSSEKQSYVIAELDRRGIPYRENSNGFDALECHVSEIKIIEKSYKPKSESHRDTLRDLIDKSIMQSASFDKFLERLQKSGCEVRHGKYLAVKPKYATNFIRTHQLGGEYSEQALKNRLTYKQKFEADTDSSIVATAADTPEHMVQKTIRHYTIVFAAGVLPVRKVRKKKAFCWENCAELDKLVSLNRKINDGISLESLRDDFARLERVIAAKEEAVATLKNELVFFNSLYNKGVACFAFGEKNQADLTTLAEEGVTAENYHRIQNVIAANESEIARIESALSGLRSELHDTVDTLDTLEKVMGKTFVQGLVDEHKPRLQADFVPNGLRVAL